MTNIDHLDRVHYTLAAGGKRDVPEFLACYESTATRTLQEAGLTT